jgi:hypothetical protein
MYGYRLSQECVQTSKNVKNKKPRAKINTPTYSEKHCLMRIFSFGYYLHNFVHTPEVSKTQVNI